MKIEIIEGEFSNRGRALCYAYIRQMYVRMMEKDKKLISPNLIQTKDGLDRMKIEVKPYDNRRTNR